MGSSVPRGANTCTNEDDVSSSGHSARNAPQTTAGVSDSLWIFSKYIKDDTRLGISRIETISGVQP